MRVAVLIDGGHIRAELIRDKSKDASSHRNPNFIEQIANSCVEQGEILLRVLYYDCPLYSGKVRLPISGSEIEFKGDNSFLSKLSEKPYFAVRLGVLKFRGYKPKSYPLPDDPKDSDFMPDFEQKGVDMRIGVDIANFAARKTVDRVVLLTNDTDFLPAMKYARIAGLQVAIASLPTKKPAAELLRHSDFHRKIRDLYA